MTSQAIEGACAFAWRNYLLLHSGISENDDRRFALFRRMESMGPILGNIPSHIAQMDGRTRRRVCGNEIHGGIGPHLALKVCVLISGPEPQLVCPLFA